MTDEHNDVEVGEDETGVSSTATLEDSEDREHHDGEDAGPDGGPSGRGEPVARFGGAVKARLLPALLGVALIASGALATVLYFTQYRADQRTDAQAAQAAVQAATDGTVALLSYAPDTLDQDFSNAKSHLTGDFLSYYTDFTTKVVTPAAQQKKVKTNAKVVQGAVAELTPDSAVVLLFINQTTTSQELPDGSFAVSSVKVGMTKDDGHWLISSFDPV